MWSESAWVVSRCVGVTRSRSIASNNGPSGAPVSTKTAVPPGSSATRYAFESHEGCMLRSTSISRIVRQEARRDGRMLRRRNRQSTTEDAMGWMDQMFEEREVRERAARLWWIFLLTGIAWLVFALIVFQWSYVSVAAISYLFGVVAIVAGVNELFQLGVSTT